MSVRAVQAVERLVAEDRDADDVLRSTVRILVEEPRVVWAGIAFLEDGKLVLGPSSGRADERSRARVPVSFQGEPVGELWVDGEVDEGLLGQVAQLVSAHVLIGWDTRGEAWEP